MKLPPMYPGGWEQQEKDARAAAAEILARAVGLGCQDTELPGDYAVLNMPGGHNEGLLGPALFRVSHRAVPLSNWQHAGTGLYVVAVLAVRGTTGPAPEFRASEAEDFLSALPAIRAFLDVWEAEGGA